MSNRLGLTFYQQTTLVGKELSIQGILCPFFSPILNRKEPPFFPIPCLFFQTKESKKKNKKIYVFSFIFFTFFLETTTTYEKQ